MTTPISQTGGFHGTASRHGWVGKRTPPRSLWCRRPRSHGGQQRPEHKAHLFSQHSPGHRVERQATLRPAQTPLLQKGFLIRECTPCKVSEPHPGVVPRYNSTKTGTANSYPLCSANWESTDVLHPLRSPFRVKPTAVEVPKKLGSTSSLSPASLHLTTVLHGTRQPPREKVSEHVMNSS